MSTRTDYRDRLLEVLPENEALRAQLAEAVALLRDHDAYFGSLRMLKAVTGPSIEARHNKVVAFLARIDADGKAGV